MPTWKEQAAQIIAQATSDLPDGTTLAERKRVVNAACPSSWRMMSWPQKAWQAARRDYLARFGYEPRTKKRAERNASAVSDLPLFGEDN